jgi:hypothetical protein
LVRGHTLAELGEEYQFQGARSNDCGPTNLAMIMNLLLRTKNVNYHFDNHELAQAMQDASDGLSSLGGILGFRLNKLFPKGLVGATHPWGMKSAFSKFDKGLAEAGHPKLGTMRWRLNGTKERLISNLTEGVFSTLMLVWEGGGAHWVTVVGYHQGHDRIIMLDPATGGDKSAKTPTERFLKVDWSWVDERWSRRPWWFGFQKRVMIETRPAPDPAGSKVTAKKRA